MPCCATVNDIISPGISLRSTHHALLSEATMHNGGLGIWELHRGTGQPNRPRMYLVRHLGFYSIYGI